MNSPTTEPDPATIFACAQSLWQACHEAQQRTPGLNLSECFNGIDEFMRVIMRIGEQFERWACGHVAFEELTDVWPYLMQDRFGTACLEVIEVAALHEFHGEDCLRVALRLRLPVKISDGLPVPLDLKAANPVAGSGFHAFRIRTVRSSLDGTEVFPFTADDDPFDDELSAPCLALYGVDAEGMPEHIADRATYAEVLKLARSLAPGIGFPEAPNSASQG